MDNPAFGDETLADEVGEIGDTTAGSESTDAGESGDSGSSSGPDTTDSTDAVDTADTSDNSDNPGTDSTDAIEVDLPLNECGVALTEPYLPIYGSKVQFDNQACPDSVANQYLKVTGAGTDPGLVAAKRCTTEGCLVCDGESLPLGAVGLEDFSAPLIQAAQNQIITCVKIQAGPFVGIDAQGHCVYDSLWAGTLASSLLLVVRQPSQLPPAGLAMLGMNDPPAQGAMHESCSCEDLYIDNAENLNCCNLDGDMPTVWSLAFAGEDVWPGDSATIPLFLFDHEFHVAQAQSPPSCEADANNTLDASWALVRTGL